MVLKRYINIRTLNFIALLLKLFVSFSEEDDINGLVLMLGSTWKGCHLAWKLSVSDSELSPVMTVIHTHTTDRSHGAVSQKLTYF